MTKAITLAGAVILFVLASGGCSGGKVLPESKQVDVALPPGVKQAWFYKMPGLITDLNVAESDGSVLVALVPDPERPEKSINHYEARVYGRDGKVRWTHAFSAQIKNQAFCGDGGFAIGMASVIGPAYIAEVAPPAYRGRLAGMFQFNIVFGILVAFASNFLLKDLGENAWRWMLGVAAFPSH